MKPVEPLHHSVLFAADLLAMVLCTEGKEDTSSSLDHFSLDRVPVAPVYPVVPVPPVGPV